jgi:hypothetical protein
MKPNARTEGLLVEELNGEAVIYDLETKIVHHLNRVAFSVWRCCDGKTTLEMIARRTGTESEAADQTAVKVAVQQLQVAGLLLPANAEEGLRTRRHLLTKGAAAGAIAVPTPAMAASPPPPPGPNVGDCFWQFQPNKPGNWVCTGKVVGACEAKQVGTTQKIACQPK